MSVSEGVSLTPGSLLVATPALLDPNFADSVILLVEHDEQGTLGIVVNRASGVAVRGVLDGWADVVSDPDVLFEGGPVSTDGALAVALRSASAPAQVDGVMPFAGDLAMVNLDTPPEQVAGALAAMRVFIGYAGWGSGQLEREIEEGSWYVVPGQPDDLFRPDVTSLRRDVLRRQPGDLAWHATRPADAALN